MRRNSDDRTATHQGAEHARPMAAPISPRVRTWSSVAMTKEPRRAAVAMALDSELMPVEMWGVQKVSEGSEIMQ